MTTTLATGGERIASACVCCGSTRLEKSPAVLMPFVAHRVFGWTPLEIDASWGLRTLKPGMAYSLCNSLQCAGCGLLFLDIRFSESEMGALYNGYRNEAYTALRESYEPGYRARNEELNAGIVYIPQIEEFLAPHLSLPMRLLDWGGDTGKNTPFKHATRLFHIYDISNKPVIAGAQKVDQQTARDTTYDLIVCSNVLEHIPYPAAVVAEVSTLMRPGTVLYIEVPCEDLVRTAAPPPGLQRSKKHWHEHINFFSKKSLEELLWHCGMEILALRQLKASASPASAYFYQVACRLR